MQLWAECVVYMSSINKSISIFVQEKIGLKKKKKGFILELSKAVFKLGCWSKSLPKKTPIVHLQFV